MPVASRDTFERLLAESWPLNQWSGMTLVLAISGGADSTALARGLSALNADQDAPARIVLAHFHHGWRDSADDDQAFVAALAKDCQAEFHTATAATAASGEQQARDQRYAFLQRVVRAVGARYLVTAHTADDVVETVLHRILRGTGIAGLGGIPRTRVFAEDFVLIRPLLELTREAGRRYLQRLGQPWREDPTNAETRFTRNRIRHELLPLLREQFNPQVDQAILRLAACARLAEREAAGETRESWNAIVTRRTNDEVQLMRDAFLRLEREPRTRLLRHVWQVMEWPQQAMTFQHWQCLAELPESPHAKKEFPGRIRVECAPESIRLMRSR